MTARARTSAAAVGRPSARSATTIHTPYATVALEARAPHPPDPAGGVSQSEFAEAFGVTDQTLRNWAERGMPVGRAPDGRPRYGPDAHAWAVHWVALRRAREAAERQGIPAYAPAPLPARLSIADVWREALEQEAEEDPEGFVLVPLDWDHPARRDALARAAVGRSPTR